MKAPRHGDEIQALMLEVGFEKYNKGDMFFAYFFFPKISFPNII